MRLEAIKHLPQKLIGKLKVKIMGRKSKREKRLARKLAAEKGLIKVDIKNTNNALSASATIVNKPTGTVYHGGSSSYSNDWQHFVSDHTHYPTLVCNLGELNIWAATKSEIELHDMAYIDLVVNCTQQMLTIGKSIPRFEGNKAFERLNKHVRKVNEIMLDWSDGADLPVTLDFWLEFYQICIEQGYRNILFCCMGGHGRTGTGIACLVLANSAYEFNMSEKLVDLVRERYCKHAIETLTQENYLEELERVKKDRTDINVVNVQWSEYKPRIKKDKYTTWQKQNGLGPKTLTEVIADAKKVVQEQKDIFDGKGDSSAATLNSMEESQQANKAIVLDMLSKEERAKKDAEASARQETLKAIEDYEAEQKQFNEVKTRVASNDLKGDYECFCTEHYECLSCEYLRINTNGAIN